MKAISKQERIVRFRKRVLFSIILMIGMFIFGICFSLNSKAEQSKEVYKYYTSYEIQAGDSLWSIANDHMTADFNDRDAYISEIRKMNHLLDDEITAGEYLIISYYSDEQL